MSPKIHRFILTKLLGWHVTPGEETIVEDKKALALFAPHTSVWDAVIGFFYIRSMGAKVKIMIKKEAFKWPVAWLVRKIGGIPVDRSNPQALIVSLIHEMKESGDSCYLAICPEGTRKAVHKWKTGYHTIATQAGLPVYLTHIDFKKKEIGHGQKVELTGNAREDTDRIQQIYEDMHLTAKHPDGYTTK